MLQSLLVYWALIIMVPLLMGFVFISSTYFVLYGMVVKDIGMEQYHFGWIIAYFLNSRFFCCLQDINLYNNQFKNFLIYVYVPTYLVIYRSLSLMPIFNSLGFCYLANHTFG